MFLSSTGLTRCPPQKSAECVKRASTYTDFEQRAIQTLSDDGSRKEAKRAARQIAELSFVSRASNRSDVPYSREAERSPVAVHIDQSRLPRTSAAVLLRKSRRAVSEFQISVTFSLVAPTSFPQR